MGNSRGFVLRQGVSMNNYHPSDEELLHFAGGELDETRFEQIADHLEACASCGEVLRKTGAFPKLGDCHISLREGRVEAAHRSAERTATMISEGPGSIIGPYKLLQKLGEGGMGVVYMAEQEKPVRRVVALKIIKPGMDSSQVIARFEAERQALAMMDHHNIAKVLDAGATDTGRPYFAMELVKGVPITQYCDHNKLTPRERLEMFIPVCQSIQHAHQKRVIHRDIKPTNVLVTLYDGKPVPKVIDFGIAKATQQKLTERTMFTGIGQILGTLEYMSPEQAEMNQLDVDTRTDVYSLGVMLYELLTGSTPIRKDKLRNVGLEEMLRTIREKEPPKPSTRLSESGEALPSISSVRKTEPTKLSKLVRGDLDWIVMKALEKDRTHRYETANGLAMDVQRFLKDEAVDACPPSVRYRFRKFARRNRTMIATGSAIVGILLASTVVSGGLAIWATKLEHVASVEEGKAKTAFAAEQRSRAQEQQLGELAQQNADRATREAEKSQQVKLFLQDMLKGVGPAVALGRKTAMLQEILDQTLNRLDTDLSTQPEVQAELRVTIGDVYKELGQYDRAEHQYQGALGLYRQVHGSTHADVAATLQRLGDLHLSATNFERLSAWLEESLQIRKTLFGETHPDVAQSLHAIGKTHMLNAFHHGDRSRNGIYDTAEASIRAALKAYEQSEGDNDLAIASVLNDLSLVIGTKARQSSGPMPTGVLDDLMSLHDRAISILRKRDGDEFRKVEAKTLEFKSVTHMNRNEPERAGRMIHQSVEVASSTASGRIEALQYMHRLAAWQREKAQYKEAKATLQRIINEATELFGVGSAKTAHWQHICAMPIYDQGFRTEAVDLQRLVVSASGRGDHHHNLGFFLSLEYNDARHAHETVEASLKAWEYESSTRGKDDPFTLKREAMYGAALCSTGEIDKGVEVLNGVALVATDGPWIEAIVLNQIAQQRHRNSILFDHALDAAAGQISEQPFVAERAAKAVFIDPNAHPKFVARAVNLSEQMGEIAESRRKKLGRHAHWLDLSLGMAKYRQQQYAEAVVALDRALESKITALRTLALTFAAMSHLQQNDLDAAMESIDELGVFSVLPTKFPERFQFANSIDAFSALITQSELRELHPATSLDGLSAKERIELGLSRYAGHVKRHPDDSGAARKLAELYGWFHEDKKRHELCRDLIDLALSTNEIKSKYQAAVSFLSLPSTDVELMNNAKVLVTQAIDAVDVENLDHRTATKLAHCQIARALVEIRLGNFRAAQVWLDKSEPIVTLIHRGRWSALRSINHSHLGRRELASSALEDAEEFIWPGPKRGTLTIDLVDQVCGNDGDDDMLISWMLLNEARSLVENGRSRAQTHTDGKNSYLNHLRLTGRVDEQPSSQ